MAFLDNSGDIILDAVLTDTGRMRMAKGDGSFKIVKFALGDDEINYKRFNLNHPSGTAYADLEILQTPVLESFTNNSSLMNSKLITIPRNNLLYLPILKLNEVNGTSARNTETSQFIVAVDSDTRDAVGYNAGTPVVGVLDGTGETNLNHFIQLDQGLDTTAISQTRVLDPLLVETQFIVEIDNRLGSIVDVVNGTAAPLSYIDDDQIATYVLTFGSDRTFVERITDTSTATAQAIAGPRGTRFKFNILSSLELATGTYLFDTLGISTTVNSVAVDAIDTIIRITGGTTGYRIDVPVRFVKKQ